MADGLVLDRTADAPKLAEVEHRPGPGLAITPRPSGVETNALDPPRSQ